MSGLLIIYYFQLSLFRGSQFHFKDEMIQLYMDIHTHFITFSTICFQNVWLDIGPCAKKRKKKKASLCWPSPWAIVWKYDLPNASPPDSLSIQSGNPKAVFQSMHFFPVEKFIGVICQSPEDRGFPLYFSSLLDIFHLVCEFFLPYMLLSMEFPSPIVWLSTIALCIWTSSS